MDEELTDLFDIDSDGLPDVLNTAVGTYGYGHGVFFNSAGGKSDSFGGVNLMTVAGVLGATANDITFRNLNLVPLDFDGDGSINLLHMPQVKTYSKYTPTFSNGAWSWRRVSRSPPLRAKVQSSTSATTRSTPRSCWIFVNGDGLIDLVVSTGTEYETFSSLGRLPQGDGHSGNGSWATATTGALSDTIRCALACRGARPPCSSAIRMCRSRT